MDSPGDRAVLIELYSATDGDALDEQVQLAEQPLLSVSEHGVTNDANGRVTLLRPLCQPVEPGRYVRSWGTCPTWNGCTSLPTS